MKTFLKSLALLICSVSAVFGQAGNPLAARAVDPANPPVWTLGQYGVPLSIDYLTGRLLVSSGTSGINVSQGTAAPVTGGWPIINGEFATDTLGTFTNATQTNSVTTGSSIDGYATVVVTINGTYNTASAVFEMSDDGGTTWYTASGTRSDSSATIETGYTSLTNTTRAWYVTVAGMDAFRVRSTAVTSGTVNVRFSISAAPVGVQSTSQLAAGTNIIGALVANQSVNVSQVNGITPLMGNGVTGTGSQRVTVASDNTAFTVNIGTATTAALSAFKAEDAPSASGDVGVFILGVRRDTLAAQANTNADYNEVALTKYGAHYTLDQEKNLPTYRASTVAGGIASAVSATDIAILPGNASNSVIVTKVIITAMQTTAGEVGVYLIKRSAANTAGTSAAMTSVPMDSGDAAASSLPLSYTANPTPGATVGIVDEANIPASPAATGVTNCTYTFNMGERGKGIKLTGTAQGLAVNLNGATVTGGQFIVTYEWREEP